MKSRDARYCGVSNNRRLSSGLKEMYKEVDCTKQPVVWALRGRCIQKERKGK